eukprot:3973503-Pyramimonas_sp.AAC.1
MSFAPFARVARSRLPVPRARSAWNPSTARANHRTAKRLRTTKDLIDAQVVELLKQACPCQCQ